MNNDEFVKGLEASIAAWRASDEYVTTLEAISVWSVPAWEKAEQDFLAGDKSALLGTVATCLQLGIPVPDWARNALWEVYNNRPKSWDQAFGPPIPKGKSATATYRDRSLQSKIVLDIGHSERPIDQELFDEIGKRYNVSGAMAKRLYYSQERPDLVLASYDLVEMMFQEAGIEGAATWLREHKHELGDLMRGFLEKWKRLRSGRSAGK
jgi:hypothetical protein